MHPGPVNRGVELSGEVVDSPQTLIAAQVEAGVVVRMAVLYELLAGAGVQGDAEPQLGRGPGVSGNELTSRPLEPSDVLFSSVRVVDPRERIDALHDVLVRDGAVAELAPAGTLAAPRRRRRSIDGGGRLCLSPAFFDPHVHLRSPGQEHKEASRPARVPLRPEASRTSWRCPTPRR